MKTFTEGLINKANELTKGGEAEHFALLEACMHYASPCPPVRVEFQSAHRATVYLGVPFCVSFDGSQWVED